MSSSKVHRRGAKAGFMLFEVLLAMAVFSFVVVGLANSLGQTADAMQSSNREGEIRLALTSRLAEDQIQPIQLGIGSDPSDDPTLTIEHEWKALKMTNGNNLQLTDLYELSVRAKWKQTGQDRTQEAKIIVYHPPQ